MGVFNVGNMISAFRPPKLERIYKSPELLGQTNKSIAGMDDYRAAAGRYLGNFEDANTRAKGEVTRLNTQTEGEVNEMLGELKGASFLDDRERTRSGDLAALEGLLGRMGGGMSAADKVAAARLGYAGRPSGTYMDKARQSYLGTFAAPIASTIFGGLTSAAAGASADRDQRAGRRLGLMRYRNDLPLGLADMELAPLRALQQSRGSEISQLGGLADVNNANFGGFKEKEDQWAAFGKAADEGLNSALDTVLSLYSGGMMGGGGGGGGGMLSGIFGGGGGRASSPPMPSYQPMPAYQPMPYFPSTGYGYGQNWNPWSAWGPWAGYMPLATPMQQQIFDSPMAGTD